MAELYVKGNEETDGDSYLLSRLMDELERGLHSRCVNLMRYNGTWEASAETMPKTLTRDRKLQYEHLRDMSRLNLARPIISAVESRQRPNGFRKVNDKTMRSTDADEEFRRNHLQLKIMQGNHDTALYGSSYLLVADNGFETIHYVSPWNAITARNGECGLVYTYDEIREVETFGFYRMLFDEQGKVIRVYKKNATREHSRSVVSPEDVESVKQCAQSAASNAWSHGDGFTWQDGTADYNYAVECNSLPLVRRSTPDGMGLLDPHWSTMDRINQKVFDQLVISMMQAFKQRAVKGLERADYSEKDPEVINGTKSAGDPIDFNSIFEAGIGSLWAVPSGVDFWESSYTDITPLDTAITNDIKRLASTAGIPLDILAPDTNNGSAEGASLKREGITFLVEQLNMIANDALTRAITMSLVLSGKARADVDLFEMMWLPANPQSITDLANAASQVINVLPKKTIMKQILGMTETQIQEALRDATDENFMQGVTGANLDTNDLFNEQLPDNSGTASSLFDNTQTNTIEAQ